MATSDERYASLEIIGYSYKLFLSRIPILSFRWRRALYKSYVNKLGDRAWGMYGGQVVDALCCKKSESSQFKNVEKELENILKWLPRLDDFRGILRHNIRRQRLKYSLKA